MDTAETADVLDEYLVMKQEEPISMILMLIRLLAVLRRGMRCEYLKCNIEEASVLKAIQVMNDSMTNLRQDLDQYFQENAAADDVGQNDPKMNSGFTNVRAQLHQISQRQNVLQSKLQTLNNIDFHFIQLALNIKSQLDISINKYAEDQDETEILGSSIINIEAIPDNSTKIKDSIIGYIRREIEDKYDMVIPTEIKLCVLEFSGMFIMSSNILNLFQMNSLYVFMTPNIPKNHAFYPQKVFDSRMDDINLLEEKCAEYSNTLTVIKTNYNHILVTFSEIPIKHRLYWMWMKSIGKYGAPSDEIEGADLFVVKSILLQGNFVDNSFGTSFATNDGLSWFQEYSLTMNDTILHAPNGCYDASDIELKQFPMEVDDENIEMTQSIDFPGDETIDDEFVQNFRIEQCEVFQL